MTWVKLDDKMPEHPKLAVLDPATKWLFVEALCYCNRQLTDGRIARGELLRLDVGCHVQVDSLGRRNGYGNQHGTLAAQGAARVAALEAAGLLEWDGVAYQIHDYAVYQPTRAEVLKQLAEGKIRAKRSRERRANGGKVQANGNDGSGDPSRAVPKDKDVTARPRSPERTSARPSGGSRSPVTVHEVLHNGRLRLQVQSEAPPLPDDPPDDLEPPDDEAEP